MPLYDVFRAVANGLAVTSGAVVGWVSGALILPPLASAAARSLVTRQLALNTTSWAGAAANTVLTEHVANATFSLAGSYGPPLCGVAGAVSAFATLQIGFMTWQGAIYAVHAVRDREHHRSTARTIQELDTAIAAGRFNPELEEHPDFLEAQGFVVVGPLTPIFILELAQPQQAAQSHPGNTVALSLPPVPHWQAAASIPQTFIPVQTQMARLPEAAGLSSAVSEAVLAAAHTLVEVHTLSVSTRGEAGDANPAVQPVSAIQRHPRTS